MRNSFNLNILTPDKVFYRGEVKELITENIHGGIEILNNHIATITLLKPNLTKFIDISGKEYKAFISTGILKVRDNEVTIICEACEWPNEIDFQRAEASRVRATERLKLKDGVDISRAEVALLRSLTRLKTKGI